MKLKLLAAAAVLALTVGAPVSSSFAAETDNSATETNVNNANSNSNELGMDMSKMGDTDATRATFMSGLTSADRDNLSTKCKDYGDTAGLIDQSNLSANGKAVCKALLPQ